MERRRRGVLPVLLLLVLAVLARSFHVAVPRANTLGGKWRQPGHSAVSMTSLKGEASTKSWQQSLNTFLCTSLLFASFAQQPQPAYAKLSSSAQSINANTIDASTLFKRSEQALEQTTRNYKALNSEFNIAKRLIEDNFHHIEKSLEFLQHMESDLLHVQTKLTKISIQGNEALQQIQNEIDLLTNSVAEKYNDAETSSTKMNKPAITSRLFLQAQNEASILSQTKKQLQIFQTIHTNIQTSIQTLQSISQRLQSNDELMVKSILPQQRQGLIDAQQGISSSESLCRDSMNTCVEKGKESLTLFQQGYTSINTAQEKYYQDLLNIKQELKSLQDVSDSITTSMTALHNRQNEVTEWETTSKLSLKSSKSLFNTYASEVQGVSKSLEQNVVNFQKQFEVIAGKDIANIEAMTNGNTKKAVDLNKVKDTKNKANKNKNGNKKQNNANNNNNKDNKYLSIIQQMNVVQEKLDVAQKTGIEAEKILIQAKAQGDREAAFYTKVLTGIPASSTSTSATTSTIPSSSTAKTATTSTAKR